MGFTIAFNAIVVALLNLQPRKADSIKVGVILPLTGNVASLGVPCRNGILLAVEKFNSGNTLITHRIDLIIEDSKAEAKTAVASFNKLVSIDNVQVIIGPLTSTETLAVAPLAEKRSVVIISPGASTPALSTAGDYIFRNELSDEQGGAAQAIFAYNILGFRRMACIYMNNDYGAGLYKVFKHDFENLGGQIVSIQPFQPDTVNFRTHLAKIKYANPDALFIIAVDEVVNIIKQSHEIDFVVPFYATPIFENITYLDQLGDLAEGVIYVYYGSFDPKSTDPISQDFINSYTDRFNEKPTYYSALGYDAASIILKVIKDSNYSLTNLRSMLYKIHDFTGVTGSCSFNNNGDIEKPVLLKKVAQGKFVVYIKNK